MPIPLIQPLIAEKNKIEQDVPWLLCLKLVNVAGDLTIRLVNNTENITYQGDEYIAFPFELDPIPEVTRGSLPSVALKVSNVDRQIQSYVEQDATFGSGWSVTLYLVHAGHLAETPPEGQVSEIEQEWRSLDLTADNEFLTINLGMPNPMLIQFPAQKFTGGFCQRTFSDDLGCPYATEGKNNNYTFCKKTLANCKERFDTQRTNSKGEKIGLPYLAFGGMELRAIYES